MIGPRCDYAGCRLSGPVQDDGWHFCLPHYREHRADLHGEPWPRTIRTAEPAWCADCGKVLPPRSGAGRPRLTCSDLCRHREWTRRRQVVA